MSNPKALVLYGDGFNCEEETCFALSKAEFDTSLVHVSDLLKNPPLLKSNQMLVLPGGFSYGDEIRAGKVLAVKLRDHLQEALHNLVDRGALILGICNGFQVLIQIGLLPQIDSGLGQKASLVNNNPEGFIDRWVELSVEPGTNCNFLTGLTNMELPIRHGEGRLVINPLLIDPIKTGICLRFKNEVNDSFDRCAALTNKKGNVLGLMPHPEAFIRWTQHPAWTSIKQKAYSALTSQGSPKGGRRTLEMWSDRLPDGLKIFQNARKCFD